MTFLHVFSLPLAAKECSRIQFCFCSVAAAAKSVVSDSCSMRDGHQGQFINAARQSPHAERKTAVVGVKWPIEHWTRPPPSP